MVNVKRLSKNDLRNKPIEEIPTGLPIDFTKFLRDQLAISVFVETGTGLGRSSEIASRLFDTVYTIEADEGRWKAASERFANRNVTTVFGESPKALIALISELEILYPHETFLFFLDAHCLYRSQVKDNACPLLEEIEAIDGRHVIFVDDEHAFTSVPHPKEVRKDYPELPEVVASLKKADKSRYIIIEGKVIAALPRHAQEAVDNFIHKERYS